MKITNLHSQSPSIQVDDIQVSGGTQIEPINVRMWKALSPNINVRDWWRIAVIIADERMMAIPLAENIICPPKQQTNKLIKHPIETATGEFKPASYLLRQFDCFDRVMLLLRRVLRRRLTAGLRVNHDIYETGWGCPGQRRLHVHARH